MAQKRKNPRDVVVSDVKRLRAELRLLTKRLRMLEKLYVQLVKL